MAETRPQAGSKRKWSEVWNEIIARPKSPDLPSCVPIDAPSTSLYKPLPTEKHIRILTIQPASKLEDQIHCDLEVVLCTAEAQYEALSYSWAMENGDCSRNRVIHVGRRDVTITQNLFEGLRRIRHARGLVRIWVDALCINQNDVAERNSQVAQMYQIYENAQETLVWLGEDPCGRGSPVEDNNAALSAMVLMEGIRKPHEIRMLFGGSEDCICIHKGGNLCICGGFLPALAVGIDERWRDLFAAVPGLKEHTANLVKTIESFHRARYWTRRWVVQEYASEPRTLFWGDAQHAAWWDIDMKRLSSMARGVGGLHGRVAPTTHLVSGMTGLGETGLTELLAYFQTMKCSEDHDILYSLLSLSNPFELNIDYDCTFSELCYEFSKRAVAEGYWNFIFANSGVNGSRKAVEKCSDCGSSDPGSSDPEDSDQESSGSESSDSERVAPPPRFPDLNLPTWVADLRQIRYARWEPEGPPPWFTNPEFRGHRLVVHAFFVAVVDCMRSLLEWTARTGSDYMQHGDESRLKSNLKLDAREAGFPAVRPGDLLFLPDSAYREEDGRHPVLVVRPRSTLAGSTRVFIQVLGTISIECSYEMVQEYQSEDARIVLEIV